MPINIEIKIVPFGQIKLEIGKYVPSTVERPESLIEEVVRYHEPQETSSRIYEVQYIDKLTNYIIPYYTG